MRRILAVLAAAALPVALISAPAQAADPRPTGCVFSGGSYICFGEYPPAAPAPKPTVAYKPGDPVPAPKPTTAPAPAPVQAPTPAAKPAPVVVKAPAKVTRKKATKPKPAPAKAVAPSCG